MLAFVTAPGDDSCSAAGGDAGTAVRDDVSDVVDGAVGRANIDNVGRANSVSSALLAELVTMLARYRCLLNKSR